jgi:hypothetical protein
MMHPPSGCRIRNRGLGYAVIQTYATFDMPRMYALLAVGVNVVPGRYTELPGTRRPSDAH